MELCFSCLNQIDTFDFNLFYIKIYKITKFLKPGPQAD